MKRCGWLVLVLVVTSSAMAEATLTDLCAWLNANVPKHGGYSVRGQDTVDPRFERDYRMWFTAAQFGAGDCSVSGSLRYWSRSSTVTTTMQSETIERFRLADLAGGGAVVEKLDTHVPGDQPYVMTITAGGGRKPVKSRSRELFWANDQLVTDKTRDREFAMLLLPAPNRDTATKFMDAMTRAVRLAAGGR